MACHQPVTMDIKCKAGPVCCMRWKWSDISWSGAAGHRLKFPVGAPCFQTAYGDRACPGLLFACLFQTCLDLAVPWQRVLQNPAGLEGGMLHNSNPGLMPGAAPFMVPPPVAAGGGTGWQVRGPADSGDNRIPAHGAGIQPGRMSRASYMLTESLSGLSDWEGHWQPPSLSGRTWENCVFSMPLYR